ncbi:CDP-alcohol phosphatidyltransferase [Undibacterium sp. YM2]|uniref:GlcG/HbpS family heme-binding protein n=1 Tax=Undibacterium sp. YM2 TaxID=2058625 RepID=UPI001331C955|nr:heme-binding protein [Undibacterium sp. YM2]BBB65761.1 CDP-alcohol phosphatidyltransferase [Undibacterium sp. YM2]
MQTTNINKSFAAASITRDAANALITAAGAAARDIGIDVTIAVTDNAGHLKAFERADSAAFLTVDVAIDKAWTAASFGLPPHTWTAIIGNEVVAQLAHRPRLVAVGGGCPIIENGKVIGGIGISGGNALQDQQAAEITLAALGFEVKA